jgi:hypothetical protein
MLAHIGNVEEALQPTAAPPASERLRQSLAPLGTPGS